MLQSWLFSFHVKGWMRKFLIKVRQVHENPSKQMALIRCSRKSLNSLLKSNSKQLFFDGASDYEFLKAMHEFIAARAAVTQLLILPFYTQKLFVSEDVPRHKSSFYWQVYWQAFIEKFLPIEKCNLQFLIKTTVLSTNIWNSLQCRLNIFILRKIFQQNFSLMEFSILIFNPNTLRVSHQNRNKIQLLRAYCRRLREAILWALNALLMRFGR